MISTLILKTLIAFSLVSALPAFAQECDDFIGAGVLPYVVLADGSIKVLLAHEEGRGWSSFGGGPKMRATSKGAKSRCETRRETAVREAIEESRRVLSKQVLESALKTAAIYPRQYGRRDFLTYVVAIPPADINKYSSNVVPANDPGYDETNALGWVTLGELLRLAKADKNEAVVPAVNTAGFYPHFRKGLRDALRADDVQLFDR